MKVIPYGRQWVAPDDIRMVEETLRSEYLTQGPKVAEFEQALASSVNSKYAVVFNSGTAALHAAYKAVGLGISDDFITSPITFVATTNAGLYLGAKPVFVDVETSTGNIDAAKIEKAITKKTKLIVPVHYGGYPADLKSIRQLANKYKLSVIEDACHALGATYNNEKIGNCAYSDIAIFSFHPVKHITTGEGGATTTNNKNLYEKMLVFRSHGITKDPNRLIRKKEGDWYYEMHELGFNYRLSDIQASLGISQLKKLHDFVSKRREIANMYNHAFANNSFFNILEEENGRQSAYHLYPILLKDKYIPKRKIIFSKLREKGIGVQVHYIPIFNQPYYQKTCFRKNRLVGAEYFYRREISIPIYPSLRKKEINYVIETLNKVLQNI